MAWRRGQTYAQDVRDRVLATDTLTARQVAARFGVSTWYVVKTRRRRALTGARTPRPQKPCVAHKLVHLHGALQERVAQVPEATLAEHREWLAEVHGVIAGLSPIWKTLKQLKLTRKKVAPGGRADAGRRRSSSRAMARSATQAGREQAHFPRPDLGQDQHDAAVWPPPARRASGRFGAVRTLDDDDVPGRATP